jgi:hypothetical protein
MEIKTGMSSLQQLAFFTEKLLDRFRLKSIFIYYIKFDIGALH